MRFVHVLVLAAVFTAFQGSSARAETLFPGSVARPNNRGDQAIFYYDVRDGFTTFLNVRNQSASALTVSVLFYSGTEFGAPFTHTLTLPIGAGTNGSPGNGGMVIVDVGALRASGLPAAAGVAIATAVNELGEAIVTRDSPGTSPSRISRPARPGARRRRRDPPSFPRPRAPKSARRVRRRRHSGASSTAPPSSSRPFSRRPPISPRITIRTRSRRRRSAAIR